MKDFASDLLSNIQSLHTTDLGIERIKKNLALESGRIVELCKEMVRNPHAVMTKNGKNWYVTVENCRITINASSYTIITAHRIGKM